ncbi:complex I NDUFA9 subunit family protein [Silanimonas lenta]|uniref:complex I NDUFA9 subunit family protein n=1 Tax=Silanimonas lenta TaxID=265429 RepID=UPI0003FCFB80|nr:complex I NDUFA9 subunit family protein [Silanimonas lenta]
MKIAVLGGTGFVGRALLARLAAEGHALTVLSRNPHAHLDRLLPPGTQVACGDVYDPEFLKARFQGQDAVVNLVGILNERGDNGRGFQRAHVGLTKLVVAACQLAGVCRLLQMSSLNAGRGESFYLKSRGEAEAVVKASGLDWTIFQPSVIFGPGDGFFCRFAALLKLSPVLPLARAGTRFAPVFVGDVAEAMRRSLHDRRTVGQVYELYGPEVFTLGELVRLTARQLGLTRLVLPLPDALGRLQGLLFDFVPGKPFSSDNYRSLKLDSVGAIDGLHQLGIPPTRIGQQLPAILGSPAGKQPRYDRYRAAR